ncbi:uncharacterized protein A1O9_07002 [Exophiala aquamarina CBS 119918]|uniref:Major facilitator superfamily (MFS) profile domain-containing protein n=1 Tax=Exophiala aquamarina CBS 119918 TaxID=1182545 RepID=A0A072PAP8_9EURO|nr:uncharacterized protein A1O9_07002 [Exophiala aquamarina CBS 119918]KEF56812.1 hypothetical protein A1O9_07002 [Exophiala aquamarina CBS 119918]
MTLPDTGQRFSNQAAIGNPMAPNMKTKANAALTTGQGLATFTLHPEFCHHETLFQNLGKGAYFSLKKAFQGIAPAFVGEFSDNAGRRPAYLVCGLLYIAANIGLALQNTYAGLLVLRCLQSAGSSGTISLIYAVVADVVTTSERGSYVVYASIAPQIGPSVGPVIGGLLAEYANWHFIFWFLVIVACLVFIPLGLFFPETCRKIVGNGSIPPAKFNRCLTNKLREKGAAATEGISPPSEDTSRSSTTKTPRLRFPNPFSVLRLLIQKECGPILVYAALVSSGMFSTVALIPSQFQRIYGFNELQISLCYIPLGCGTIAAAFVRGRILDSRFRYYAKQLQLEVVKNRRMDLTNFPLERARIEVALPTLFLGAACTIGFGWTLQYETSLAGPLILVFFIGFSASATSNTLQVLLVDIYPGRPGAVTAANNLLRCWLGAGASALVIPMIDAMGIGWTSTFFSLIVIAFSPLLWYIMKHGPRWRREAAAKLKRKLDDGV